jgi:V-type H+-transporting ATPase subunit a
MMVLFGYMDLLIIVKWCTDWSGREHEAPSVISSMIEMALNGGATAKGFTPILGGAQQGLSIFFLLVALVCVPSMLFPKPLYIEKQNKLHAGEHHNKNHIQL